MVINGVDVDRYVFVRDTRGDYLPSSDFWASFYRAKIVYMHPETLAVIQCGISSLSLELKCESIYVFRGKEVVLTTNVPSIREDKLWGVSARKKTVTEMRVEEREHDKMLALAMREVNIETFKRQKELADSRPMLQSIPENMLIHVPRLQQSKLADMKKAVEDNDYDSELVVLYNELVGAMTGAAQKRVQDIKDAKKDGVKKTLWAYLAEYDIIKWEKQ